MVQLTDLSLGEPGARFAADSVIAPLPARPLTSTWRRGANHPVPVFAIGDCQSARTALEAIYEGHEAARNL